MSFKSKIFEAYSLEEISEYNDTARNYLFNFRRHLLTSKNWNELFKTAGYYFDNPSPNQRINAFNKIRGEYYDLVKEDLPQVNSRNDLLTWVCRKHNEVNTENKIDCNLDILKKKFGPNEQQIKNTFSREFKML